MRILLDECVPRRLAAQLAEHTVRTVGDIGWAGRKDRELLALAASKFNVLVTVDQNLSFQQNLANARLAIIVLVVRSNRLDDLLPLVPALKAAIARATSGDVQRVGT